MNANIGLSDQGFGYIQLPARFDFACAGFYRTALAKLLVHAHAARVVLDMSELTYVDSVGLATLISWERFCKERATELVLEGCSKEIREELKLLGVYRLFSVQEAAHKMQVPLPHLLGERASPA